MAVQTISYTNKVDLNSTSVADINKVKASDLNEIKTVVNNNASELTNLQETVLYSDSTGTTGNVVLSDTYTNYKYIEIFGKRSSIASSTKFDTTLNDTVSLSISHRNSSTTITLYTCTLTFSGTGASVVGGAVAFSSSAIAGFTGSNEIYIVKVVGYK